jgi:hypothetical protein
MMVISLSAFVTTIHVRTERQERDLEKLQQMLTDRAINQYSRMNDLDQRLSRIEGSLNRIEKWCEEILGKRRK